MGSYLNTLAEFRVLARHSKDFQEVAYQFNVHQKISADDEADGLRTFAIGRGNDKDAQSTMNIAEALIARFIPFDFELTFPPENFWARCNEGRYHYAKCFPGEPLPGWAHQEVQWCESKTRQLLMS